MWSYDVPYTHCGVAEKLLACAIHLLGWCECQWNHCSCSCSYSGDYPETTRADLRGPTHPKKRPVWVACKLIVAGLQESLEKCWTVNTCSQVSRLKLDIYRHLAPVVVSERGSAGETHQWWSARLWPHLYTSRKGEKAEIRIQIYDWLLGGPTAPTQIDLWVLVGG